MADGPIELLTRARAGETEARASYAICIAIT